MPRRNRRRRDRRQDELTPEQDLDLICGEAMGAFGSPKEREAAWETHKNELLASTTPGFRPQAWWDFEGYSKLSDDEDDSVALERLGVLTPEEKRILRKWARPHDVTVA